MIISHPKHLDLSPPTQRYRYRDNDQQGTFRRCQHHGQGVCATLEHWLYSTSTMPLMTSRVADRDAGTVTPFVAPESSHTEPRKALRNRKIREANALHKQESQSGDLRFKTGPKFTSPPPSSTSNTSTRRRRTEHFGNGTGHSNSCHCQCQGNGVFLFQKYYMFNGACSQTFRTIRLRLSKRQHQDPSPVVTQLPNPKRTLRPSLCSMVRVAEQVYRLPSRHLLLPPIPTSNASKLGTFH
jgi:hypothetical protein